MKFNQFPTLGQPTAEIYAKEHEKAKARLLELFNGRSQEEIDKLYSEIRAFAGIVGLDPESIIAQIRKGFDLENPEEFVNLSFEVIKKIIDQKIEHPEIFERIRRERIIQQSGNIRLSELMYYKLDLENGAAIVHLAPKGELKLGKIIKAFRDGLKELAKQVEEDEKIVEIQAISWIVASNPGLLEKAGFTVEGPIDEKMKMEHFSDEKRPISWAHIDRKAFLEKYLAD